MISFSIGICAQQKQIKVVSRGGMCPYGGCRTTVIIDSNGSYTWTEGSDGLGYESVRGTGKLQRSEIDKLLNEINSTDFVKVKSEKFQGTCPTAFDGQENVYYFPTREGEEIIPSCTYAIDKNEPLFIHLKKLLLDIRSRPNKSSNRIGGSLFRVKLY
jgi:hypothetical protein